MTGVLTRYGWLPDKFAGVREEQGGAYVNAACPLRCHRSAHLRFWVGQDGRLMLTCFAGCDKLEILRAAGLGWKDCFPADTDWQRVKREVTARYVYADEQGTTLYMTCRLEPGHGGKDKTFFQRRPAGAGWVNNLDGVRYVLYRQFSTRTHPGLDRFPGLTTYIVAGEKDADTLWHLGLPAVTNVGGERKEWLDAYSLALAGRNVVVVEDADSAGRRHANEVAGSLMAHGAASVRRVKLPGAKDATAFLNGLRVKGVTNLDELRAALVRACGAADVWSPDRVGV